MSNVSSILVHVFALFKKIEFNIIEERVVKYLFTKNMDTTHWVQQNNTQSCPTSAGNFQVVT